MPPQASSISNTVRSAAESAGSVANAIEGIIKQEFAADHASTDGPVALAGQVYKTTSSDAIVIRRQVVLFWAGKFCSSNSEGPDAKKMYMLDKCCELKPKSAGEIRIHDRKLRGDSEWTITATITGGASKIELYQFTVKWPLSWAPHGFTTFTMGFEEKEVAVRWHTAFSEVLQRLKQPTSSGEKGSPVPRSVSQVTEASTPVVEEPGMCLEPLAESQEEVVGRGADSDDEGHYERQAKQMERLDKAWEQWQPLRSVHGVSLFLREGHASGEGEYMFSVIINAKPTDVLRACLRHGKEVFSQKTEGSKTKQIISLSSRSYGWTGLLCAPRKFFIERMVTRDDEHNTIVMMFNSVPELGSGEAVMDEEGNMVETAVPPQESKQQGSASYGLFKKPVVGKVQGGHTISPVEGYNLNNSPSTLVTTIMKVDLGGACGSKSFLKPMADLFGWSHAFIDTLVMVVVSMKDFVEQSVYDAQPKSLRDSEEEEQICDHDSKINSMLSMRVGSADVHKLAEHLAAIDEVKEGAEAGGAAVPVVYNLNRVKSMATMPAKYWSGLHIPGKPAPFKVRGPTYLKDRKKVLGGRSIFTFSALDVVPTPNGPMEHIARFLPSIRKSGMPFGIIIHLIVPGAPMIAFVATFIAEAHPDLLGEPPADPMSGGHNWTPFDLTLHRFIKGDTATRNKMLKLIPHIADGSWMVKQTVGTTPVILGKALKTTYHDTPQYIEIDIDVSANSVANYATGMVRGATKSLIIDMGFVLEGQEPWELPEALLGCLRLDHMDLDAATPVDLTKEIPLSPPASSA